MSNTLSKKEIKQLRKIGNNIVDSLSCDINGYGVPCRTDRLEVIDNMIEYLKIHNYKIKETK